MLFSPLIDQLVDALKILPGVGPKSAQRMALQLLERDREGGIRLAEAMQQAMEGVGNCTLCRTHTEQETCGICANPKRDTKTICVVETPGDVLAIESGGAYNGLYFVLMGHLSPIDGIGPEEIGINKLTARVAEGGVEELILATNPTMEGEATAHYIVECLKASAVSVTRIAHGVPLGGELEYVDGGTLAHAFAGRKVVEAV